MSDTDSRVDVGLQSRKGGLAFKFTAVTGLGGIVWCLVAVFPHLGDYLKQHGPVKSPDAAVVPADKPAAKGDPGCSCGAAPKPPATDNPADGEKPATRSDRPPTLDEIKRAFREEIESLKKDNEALRRDLERLQAKVKEFEVLIAQLQAAAARERKEHAAQLERVTAALDAAAERMEQLQSDLDRTTAERNDERKQLEAMKAENKTLLADLEKQRLALEKLKEEEAKKAADREHKVEKAKPVTYLSFVTKAPCGRRMPMSLPDNGTEVRVKCDGGREYVCSLDPNTLRANTPRQLNAAELAALGHPANYYFLAVGAR